MWLGLALVSIGSGGIKPCVSAHVGDQFGKGNWGLVAKVFQAFYFIINFGSFFATIAIPWTRVAFGTSVAFAIPGILMLIATIFFWMGRREFVHVPPNPGGRTGQLDAIGSTLLFMGAIGLPLFFWGVLPTSLYVILTVLSLVLGLWVFYERQAIEEDDGFMAVMLHSVDAYLTGKNDAGFFSSAARKYGTEAAEGPKAVLRIISIFFLVSVFWALFDQHASSWIRQAKMMDLAGFLPSQISALNPLMVMALIPFNNFILYPLLEGCGISMTPLKKMSIGMFVASLAFVAVALIQIRIETVGPGLVHVLWQVIPYLIMTQAEVMVSITGLEFAYTQAPAKMKSTIMGFWLLSVSLGNKLTAVLTGFGDLSLAEFFWLFAGLMAVAALLFTFRASFYKYRSYTQ
jgi:POT family proton-dependent oligopeptide transporter